MERLKFNRPTRRKYLWPFIHETHCLFIITFFMSTARASCAYGTEVVIDSANPEIVFLNPCAEIVSLGTSNTGEGISDII